MSEDFLTIDTEEASAVDARAQVEASGGRQIDPTMWKPGLGRNDEPYEAKVRLLPQGVNGVKNKLPASVSYQMHYLKDKKHKISKNVPCRKTIGEECPVCEAAWAIWNAGKDAGGARGEALQNLAKSRLPTTRHVINVLVREDLTNPANNGKVLKWDHTDNVNGNLMEPLRDSTEEENGKNATQKPAKSSLRKSKEKFTPHSPRNGRDRIVIVEKNPKTGYATYDGSFWDEDGLTDLAATTEEMMGILDQCHDLSGYRAMPSAEELMAQYNEFIALVEAKERAAAVNGVVADRASSTGNDAAPPKVKTVNASSYFAAKEENNAVAGDAAEEDPFDMNDGAPSVGAQVFEEATSTDDISDSDDDDLPF